MLSNPLNLCCPLFFLLSIFFSIGVFSNESLLCIRWPKYWSFSIIPSYEYSGLISFRMIRLDLLAVQVILKSLLQHHSSKALILQCSGFVMVQLTSIHVFGKTIALTRGTFVGKVMSLLFNKLSRLVIAFLPRSKSLLIAWLQWFWSPRKQSVTVSHFSPICHEVMGPDTMILVFWVLSFKPAFFTLLFYPH